MSNLNASLVAMYDTMAQNYVSKAEISSCAEQGLLYSVNVEGCVLPIPNENVYATISFVQSTINQEVSTAVNNVTLCGEQGKVLTQALTCGHPIPSLTDFASASQIAALSGSVQELTNQTNAIEIDLGGVLAQLNQTSGNHAFCAICDADFYVSGECNGLNSTTCSPCRSGSYSFGGYATDCIDCPLGNKCDEGTCSAIGDVICTDCTQKSVVNGNALVPAGDDCQFCPENTYRSDAFTCSPCPATNKCVVAMCQTSGTAVETQSGDLKWLPYSFDTTLGWPSMSSTSATTNDIGASFGLTPDTGVHSAFAQGHPGYPDSSNVWWQYEFPTQMVVFGFTFKNRPDNCGARTFQQTTACPALTNGGIYNGPNQGAIFRVSNTSCMPGQVCPGTMCFFLTTHDSDNTYSITCEEPVAGTFLSLQLPGTGRMLNFLQIENIQVLSPTAAIGFYEPIPPDSQECVISCEKTISCWDPICSDASTSVCNGPHGCNNYVTLQLGVDGPFAFDPNTQQCMPCQENEYLDTTGSCTMCPAGCPSSCQASGIVSDGTASQSSTFASYGAQLARNGDVTSVSHTGNNDLVPWWQFDFGAQTEVFEVSVTNRQGPCGARMFASVDVCDADIVNAVGTNDRDWNGPYEGAVIRVANVSCTTGSVCPGEVCGKVVRPSAATLTYIVQCTTPLVGSYLNIQLIRHELSFLQLADVQIVTSAKGLAPVTQC